MPEVEYTTTMALARGLVWEFVKDMNNWAPMLTGYQTHEILDETDSLWTLKGDVGILSRIVKLRAHVTEWIDGEKVSFTLTGLNEKVDGGGVLVMETIASSDATPAIELAKKPKRRWFGRRFLDWFFRRMFRRKFGAGPARLAAPEHATERARLTFTLRMDAGGPTGPLVNAMLGPALLPAAEDLANKIAAHLEHTHLAAAARMILGEVVQRAARERPGDLAIADGTALISAAQLAVRASGFARALLARGIGRGDRVAIWAPNSWRWIVAAAGAHAIGAVLVPINTRYKADEAARILADSGARALVTVDEFLGTRYLAMLRAAATSLPEVVVIADDDAWNAFHTRSAPEAELVRARGRVEPSDPGDLMFTSGTTGAAKGIVATHAQTLRAYGDWAAIVGLRRGDRYLVVAPFFHSFGYKAGWLAALLTGATIHPHAVFDADAVLARIAAERISVLPGPPTLYVSLLAHPGRAAADLGSLRLAVTGAAVIPVELVERMRAELGFETVLTGYGLTESTGVATLCRPGDDAETIATTSGRAMPGVEIAIRAGEIVVRGYNVAAPADADGWLSTGDAGALDARGNLRITDRIKDMFIVGGFNAYPAEIEAAMRAHPAIAQVAVIGAPDERLGEIGVAFVVARAGAAVEEGPLIAWCRERMANFKVPRRVMAVDALPQNASGKVLKHVLRARLT